MPTGTKIAAIVLVVLLGAAGLYYAFVPPAPAPKFDPTKGSGSSVTDPLSRPSTLPPSGSSASTGTAATIDALANRSGFGAPGTNTGTNTGTTANPNPTGTAGTIPGMSNTAPAGAVAGANTVSGATVPGTAVPGAPVSGAPVSGAPVSGAANSTAPRAAFNNGFRNGPGTSPSPGTSVGTTGTIPGASPTDTTGLAAGGTVGTNSTGSTIGGSSTGSGTSLTGSNSASAVGSESTYVVKKGDSFESISKSIYGTTTKWKEISKANPTVDPTRMKIGAKLRIPAAGASVSTETSIASASSGTSSSSSSKSSTKSAAGSTSGGTHVIAKGDTFSSLARSYYGDSKFWKAIAKANPKISEKSLAIGTKIAIPPKSTVVSGGNVER